MNTIGAGNDCVSLVLDCMERSLNLVAVLHRQHGEHIRLVAMHSTLVACPTVNVTSLPTVNLMFSEDTASIIKSGLTVSYR